MISETVCLTQALCRAEDEEDIVAASQAKAEQVAELAEFNENIPLDDGGEQEEVEELSKAEQEIAALVEQVSHSTLLLNCYIIVFKYKVIDLDHNKRQLSFYSLANPH